MITLQDIDHWPNQVLEGLFLPGGLHGSRRCPETSITFLFCELVYMHHAQNFQLSSLKSNGSSLTLYRLGIPNHIES